MYGGRVASSLIHHCCPSHQSSCGWCSCNVDQDGSNNCHPSPSGNLHPSCHCCCSGRGSVSKTVTNGIRFASFSIRHCRCGCQHCCRGWHPCNVNQDNSNNCHPPPSGNLPPSCCHHQSGGGNKSLWNSTSLGLRFSKYLAILAKSLPNEIPAKFHLLRKFLHNSICSRLGINSELARNPAMCLVHN
jgi:hypothetical protein